MNKRLSLSGKHIQPIYVTESFNRRGGFAMHKCSTQSKLTKTAHLIMCGSHVKPGRKDGKKLLAYQLLCKSLLQAERYISSHIPKLRDRDTLSACIQPQATFSTKCFAEQIARLALLTRPPTSMHVSIFIAKFMLRRPGAGCTAQKPALGPLRVKMMRLSMKQKYEQMVSHLLPSVRVRQVRIGGGIHQVPILVNKRRQQGLALRSLIQSAAQSRKNDSVTQKLVSSTNSEAALVQNFQLSGTNKDPSLQCTFHSFLSLELLAVCRKSSQSIVRRDQTHNTAATNRGYAHYRWW